MPVNDDLALFKGYKKRSPRYNTKRKQELAKRDETIAAMMVKIRERLANKSSLTAEQIDIYQKRLFSLESISSFSVKDRFKDTEKEMRIPFFVEKHTEWIRESKCFSDKNIERFGQDFIIDRITAYKATLKD